MAKFQSKKPKGPLPSHWLHCPKMASELIHNIFIAFKTPLSSEFNDQIPREDRFTPNMLFSSLKKQNVKMGLLIDLTNTTRYYDRGDIEVHGCQYLKLSCRGHDQAPSVDQVRTFIDMCKTFVMKHPTKAIGVHCTHGFNRTGFLISSYLIEMNKFTVDNALALFGSVRNPGIYKEYLRELYCRYDNVKNAPAPPETPAWCLELDSHYVKDRNQNSRYQTPRFYPAPLERLAPRQNINSHVINREPWHQMPKHYPTLPDRPVRGPEFNHHRFEARNSCHPMARYHVAHNQKFNSFYDDRNFHHPMMRNPALPEGPVRRWAHNNHRFEERARDSSHPYFPMSLKRPAKCLEYNNYVVDNRRRNYGYHFTGRENPGQQPSKMFRGEFSQNRCYN